MQQTEQYEHHGRQVHVISALKGKHREHCLCFQCDRFKPGEDDHCPIARLNYQMCVDHGLVSPVYECASYEPAAHAEQGA